MKVTFEPAARDDRIDRVRQEIVIVSIAHGAQDREGKAP